MPEPDDCETLAPTRAESLRDFDLSLRFVDEPLFSESELRGDDECRKY
jgi:hypothetical protein